MTSSSCEPLAMAVQFKDDVMVVDLEDGRSISLPLEWFPSLRNASKDDREAWEFVANGEGIHWPRLDEDLSVRGFLALDAGPLSPRKRFADLGDSGVGNGEDKQPTKYIAES